ncbi:glycosyl transferase family protein [Cryptosporidium serpentis]
MREFERNVEFQLREFRRHGKLQLDLILISILIAVIALLYRTYYFLHIIICSILSIIVYITCCNLIPSFSTKLLENRLYGYDINKIEVQDNKQLKQSNFNKEVLKNLGKSEYLLDNRTKVPEALGIVPACIFMIAVICNQLLFNNDPSKLLEYNSGLLSICMMTFLGFADDVLNLRWRYKMVLPVFATLPTLVSYSGGTQIIFPSFFWSDTRFLIDLGYFYYIYMLALTVFCTNSINIYAGINGLEVGQSLIISIAIIIHNIVEICLVTEFEIYSGKSTQHFLSILFMLPFISCSLGLFYYNKYPSLVFVGDTYTYFAGVCLAVVSILGHFSKTLLLFFIPQIINFLISIPQLFGLIHCPRHRVPRINPKTGKLESSKNLTLLNLMLEVFGPMTEKTLANLLFLLQIISCIIGFLIRYSNFLKNTFE